MAWEVNAGRHVSTIEGCHKDDDFSLFLLPIPM